MVSPSPLASAHAALRSVRLVATDIDGTLTQRQSFTPRLLEAFQDLAQFGIQVLLTTGRSAGWVNGLCHYLPVAGAIAENGGVLMTRDGQMTMLSAIGDIASHRQSLASLSAELVSQFPGLHSSADNAFRLTDWTVDLDQVSPETLAAISQHCHGQGWSFTYSTVQGHIKPAGQDKAIGLRQTLARQFPDIAPSHLVTIGDSPNDEAMFNPDWFPLSVGVANIRHYLNVMQYPPRYITTHPEIAGFCELVQHLRSATG